MHKKTIVRISLVCTLLASMQTHAFSFRSIYQNIASCVPSWIKTKKSTIGLGIAGTLGVGYWYFLPRTIENIQFENDNTSYPVHSWGMEIRSPWTSNVNIVLSEVYEKGKISDSRTDAFIPLGAKPTEYEFVLEFSNTSGKRLFQVILDEKHEMSIKTYIGSNMLDTDQGLRIIQTNNIDTALKEKLSSTCIDQKRAYYQKKIDAYKMILQQGQLSQTTLEKLHKIKQHCEQQLIRKYFIPEKPKIAVNIPGWNRSDRAYMKYVTKKNNATHTYEVFGIFNTPSKKQDAQPQLIFEYHVHNMSDEYEIGVRSSLKYNSRFWSDIGKQSRLYKTLLAAHQHLS